ncbi:MAG: hypothetical protein U5K27_20320 [Desulfotignum sp.]|nr:hypothetical protein [Desulfotignum sp.]
MMSVLFTPQRVGHVDIKNRFVHSATYEGMADADGQVTNTLIKRYRQLAEGEVGLIIPGFMYVHSLGQACQPSKGTAHPDGMGTELSHARGDV